MMLMNKRKNYRLLFMLAITGICSLYSCNREFPDAANKLDKDYPPNYSGNATAAKRVLYIILDGAQGSEVKQLAPVNITKLTRSAIYTWIGISGYNPGDTTLPSAWTSMMTGVSSAKSKVITGFDSADLQAYPSFVTRLAAQTPAIKVDAYTASSDFNKYLLSGAAQNVLTQDDDAKVAQNVENALKTDSAKVVIGQFHSIAVAGNTYGYKATAPQYASAVNTVDGYIGDIMNALKSRANYANENWLVIVASNENGKINQNAGGDSTSAYNDTRRNSFVIFNNVRFQADFIGSNGTPSTLGLSAYNDSALLFTGTGSTGVNVTIPNKNNMFDVTQGDSVTIEFKYKQLGNITKPTNTDYFMNLFSNGGAYGGSNGIGVVIDGSTLKVFLCDPGFVVDYNSSVSVTDGNWHSFSITFMWPKNSMKVTSDLYVDGVLDKSAQAYGDATTTLIHPANPVFIGNAPPFTASYNAAYGDHLITDFRYWKTMLPYNIITQYACKNDVPDNTTFYSKLISDIRLNDGNNATTVKDLSPFNNNGAVNDASDIRTWNHFDEVSNAVCPAPDVLFYKASPNGLDIPFQIYQWLGMVPMPIWGLDGQYWNSGYTDVQLPANE